MQLHTKHAHPAEMKFDDEAGTVTAVFATLHVKDSDGDVTLPGFFGEQEVAIAKAHDPATLVGKGRIFESGDTAILEGKYFLETIAGREEYLTAKAMGDLQEWSYGFYLQDGGYSFGDHKGERVRFLQPKDDGSAGADIREVSTVLTGAGVGTHTVGIKSSGQRFVDQAEEVAKAAELLVARASEIQAMRAEKGKALGDESRSRLHKVAERLESVAVMLGSVLAEPEPTQYDPGLRLSVSRVLAESQQLTQR